ncbi:MAG: PHP domain-containing protein, partial [Bacteroidota bacterium]
MKKNACLIGMCLLTASALMAQMNTNDYIERQIDFEQQQQARTATSNPTAPATENTELNDLDRDGMEDNWELLFGFDPTDPRDAWDDADGDFILNRFEFQLQTQPNDNSSPSIINFDPLVHDLDALLDDAETGLVVVRIPEGTYPLTYTNFFTTDYQLMLQGGWNSDFSEHDPELYPTILDGENSNEVLYFSTSSTAVDDLNLSIVLEGLHLINGGGASVFGSLAFLNDEGDEGSLSVYNCKVYDGLAGGIEITTRQPGGHSCILIAKTLVVNNNGSGIAGQITGDGTANWNIYQSTISINDLVSAAAKEEMPAVAITDHGNMMGAFHFVQAVSNHNKSIKAQHAEAEANGEAKQGQLIKPIIGCEFFVCENHT